MRKLVAAGFVAVLLLGVIGTSAAGAHGRGRPISWRCVAEAARLGILGRDVNPSTHVFVSGTPGDDGAANGPDQIFVAADEVYCGLGGHDVIMANSGITIGGAGDDYMYTNRGTFYGGPGSDFVYYNAGTFNGGRGDDGIYAGPGFFDGGPGFDRIGFPGNCVNVEQAWAAPPGTPPC